MKNPKSHSTSFFKSFNLPVIYLDDITKLQVVAFVYQWSQTVNESFKFTSSVHSYPKGQSSNVNLYLTLVNFWFTVKYPILC